MNTLIGSIVVFIIVITLHELGHFCVAKMCGVKVNEFSIGMGPKLFDKVSGETKYSLRILPIGGYVAMEGEEENSDDPRAFNNVNVFKRMAVVVAGVVMNFLLAVVAFLIVFLLVGVQTNFIGKVMPNSPADIAGLKTGDQIIYVENVKTKNWNDLVNNIAKHSDNINVTVLRDKTEKNFSIKPILKDGRNIIGIFPKTEKSINKSFSAAFSQTIFVIKDVFNTLKLLFAGKVKVTMLAGPVGVISMIGQETSKGFVNLLSILGLISANLAVVNLLPIPALDGGKLLFLIIESITGKPINEKVESTLSLIGISFLFAIMLYVTVFGDITRIVNG